MPWDRTKQASTTARGYDAAHRAARADYKRTHQPSNLCCRCHHPLGPWGRWLHLDHTADRRGYLGIAHGTRPCPTCKQRCNVKAGAREARARQSTRIRTVRRRALLG